MSADDERIYLIDKKFGTDPHKLVRRNDPETSQEAAEEVNTNHMEKIVLNVIRSFGINGCISDDVRAALPDKAYSTVTARFKALSDNGYIYFTGETRKGRSSRAQRVMVADYNKRLL